MTKIGYIPDKKKPTIRDMGAKLKIRSIFQTHIFLVSVDRSSSLNPFCQSTYMVLYFENSVYICTRCNFKYTLHVLICAIRYALFSIAHRFFKERGIKKIQIKINQKISFEIGFMCGIKANGNRTGNINPHNYQQFSCNSIDVVDFN